MAVYGRIGLPRSGKSHDLVARTIIPFALEGRKIVTNLPVNVQKLAAVHGLTIAQMNNITVMPDIKDSDGQMIQPICDCYIPSEDREENPYMGAIFVHDEIQVSFNSDEHRVTELRKRFRDWLSHHGHYGCDLYWASQSDGLVDLRVRRMTELCYTYRSLKHDFRGKLSKYGKYRRCEYYVQNGEIDYADEIDRHVFPVERKIFFCYTSFVEGGSGAVVAGMPRYLRNGLIALSIIIPISIWSMWRAVVYYRTLHGGAVKPASLASISAPVSPSGASIQQKRILSDVEYDGVFYDDRDGSWILLRGGDPIARCPDPLADWLGKPVDCGDFRAVRVGSGRVPDGLPAMATDKPALPPMAGR